MNDNIYGIFMLTMKHGMHKNKSLSSYKIALHYTEEDCNIRYPISGNGYACVMRDYGQNNRVRSSWRPNKQVKRFPYNLKMIIDLLSSSAPSHKTVITSR